MKLTKEHIGKKITAPHFIEHEFFIPLAINPMEANEFVGVDQDGQAKGYYNYDDWELYQEIPENQAWVVPGKKYVLPINGNLATAWKEHPFIPEYFNFRSNEWVGHRYGSGDSSLFTHWDMSGADRWQEWTPLRKTIRIAPAIAGYQDMCGTILYQLSTQLFRSKEDAETAYSFAKTVKWPANETSWVEVEVDE